MGFSLALLVFQTCYKKDLGKFYFPLKVQGVMGESGVSYSAYCYKKCYTLWSYQTVIVIMNFFFSSLQKVHSHEDDVQFILSVIFIKVDFY